MATGHALYETTRTIVTRPRLEDAAAIFEQYSSDSDVTRFLSWPRHTSADDARAFVAFSDAEWARWPYGPVLVWRKSDGRLIGGTGLAFETRDRAATGYVFAKDAWGAGYATESLAAMVAVARTLGVSTLWAVVHAAHRASARVLEKGGFTVDGEIETSFPNLDPPVAPAVRYVRRVE